MFIMSDLPTSWRNHSNMEYRRRAININNHGSCDLSPQVKKNKNTRAYNCQRLDFFFSGRVGFSFEALKEKNKQKNCNNF